MTFEHPGSWLYFFRIGTPVMAATLVAATGIWLSLVPVIGSIIGAVALVCLVPLWNTCRHIGHRVDVSDDALSVVPYFGRSRRVRWGDVTIIREFTVVGWTARRHSVVLESAGPDWIAFFHDINRFDDLRALVRDRATSAVTKGAPPWWARLLRLGTV